MTQEQRQQLINIVITGRGDGTLDQKMALNVRFMAFRDILEAKRKKERAEAQRRREEATEGLYEADIANHGHFCMVVWSRDCDMVESTYLARYKSIKELEDSKVEAIEWAEGPVTWGYISHDDANDFESSTRDLIMENRENGGDGYHLTR